MTVEANHTIVPLKRAPSRKSAARHAAHEAFATLIARSGGVSP